MDSVYPGAAFNFFLLGNPATDILIKQYLNEVTAEQLQAQISPK